MAYKKVWKKGTVDWGAAASNYAKRSAVERRRKKKAAEVASRKAARAAQTARNKAARESERSHIWDLKRQHALPRACAKVLTSSGGDATYRWPCRR